MFYTYIIQSETTSKYYVGSTQNVTERLRRHNANHSKSTKNKGPWVLIKTFHCETRSEAMQLEKKIKGRGIGRFLKDLKTN
jgi:putative endonuclease